MTLSIIDFTSPITIDGLICELQKLPSGLRQREARIYDPFAEQTKRVVGIYFEPKIGGYCDESPSIMMEGGD